MPNQKKFTNNKHFLIFIFLGILIFVFSIGYIYYIKFLVREPTDVFVATPGGTVVLQIQKITPDPIAPGSIVKYQVSVTSGSVSASALGFTLQFSNVAVPTTYAAGGSISSSLPVKEFVVNGTQLSFVAASNVAGAISLAPTSQIATFQVTAPATAGTYTIITNITTASLPSIINASNVEVMSNSSFSPVSLVVANPNTGPTTIGNLFVKYPDPSTGVVSELAWPTGTDKYIKAGSSVTFSIDSITDTDVVSTVELYNALNNTKIGNASASGSRYSFVYNNIPLNIYRLKAVVTDRVGVKTEKTFADVNIRPDYLTFTPNGGSFATLPNVTITNPTTNGSGTVVKYAFCTTDCATITPTTVYSTPIPAQSGKSIKAFVTHTATTLSGGAAISNVFKTSTGPTTIGNLYVKYPDPSTGVVSEIAWPTGTDKYIKAGSSVTFSIDSITDVDTISLVELYNTVTSTKIGNATASGSKYSFIYPNIPLNIYRIRVVVTDKVGVKTEKTFADVNIRPDYVTFTPNGGSFTTMPLVTINNPTTNGTGTVVKYAFCTTDCSTVVPSLVYARTITAEAGKSIKAFVTHTATTLSGGTAISAVFTTQVITPVATPTFSKAAGIYAYDPASALTNSSITISTTTTGAAITYCSSADLNATTCPTYTAYSTPILINKNFKLFAKATKAGMTDSAVVSAKYQILGDVNGDNSFTLAGDVLPVLKAVFDSSLVTPLMDMNKNGVVDLIDVVTLLKLIFN